MFFPFRRTQVAKECDLLKAKKSELESQCRTTQAMAGCPEQISWSKVQRKIHDLFRNKSSSGFAFFSFLCHVVLIFPAVGWICARPGTLGSWTAESRTGEPQAAAMWLLRDSRKGLYGEYIFRDVISFLNPQQSPLFSEALQEKIALQAGLCGAQKSRFFLFKVGGFGCEEKRFPKCSF